MYKHQIALSSKFTLAISVSPSVFHSLLQTKQASRILGAMEKEVAKLEEKMSVSQHVIDDVSEQLDIKIDKTKGNQRIWKLV